jgi:hypothetical protein
VGHLTIDGLPEHFPNFGHNDCRHVSIRFSHCGAENPANVTRDFRLQQSQVGLKKAKAEKYYWIGLLNLNAHRGEHGIIRFHSLFCAIASLSCVPVGKPAS